MVRVLVADDSATSRALIVALIEASAELELAGTATDGFEAVRMTAALAPDVVTMDVRMPGLDGFEATRRIMAERPTPVVIVSNLDLADVESAMSTLKVGALAAVPKPGSPADPDFEARAAALVEAVTAMSTVKVVRRRLEVEAASAVDARPAPDPVAVVAVAASTGGPAALHTILSGLAADFAAPILVVQHIADGFVQGFVEWLDHGCALTVKIAQAGDRLRPSEVYVAPSDRHIGVRDGRIVLPERAPVGGFRPSGTVLFDEVAREYGRAAVGLVLSGMGRDGVDGLQRLVQAGATVVAQSATTCAVNGMPGAAVEAGCVHHVLDPEDISRWLSGAEAHGR